MVPDEAQGPGGGSVIHRYFIGMYQGGQEFVYQCWNENPDVVEFEVDRMLGQCRELRPVTKQQYEAKRESLIQTAKHG